MTDLFSEKTEQFHRAECRKMEKGQTLMETFSPPEENTLWCFPSFRFGSATILYTAATSPWDRSEHVKPKKCNLFH